ncbi:MAG TPA: PQQ-binding-like beta-propeller repeat protein [Verrucomicrobiae bacterium]
MNSIGVVRHGRSIRAADLWRWTGLCRLLLLGTVISHAALPQATNIWTAPFKSAVFANVSWSTPAVAPDGAIYIGAFDGILHAYNPDGKEKWRFHTTSQIKSSAAIADDGTIYFGCRDHKFYALTPDGKLKWTFETGAWVDSSAGIARDGTIYFGSWDKNFYALTPAGALKWKFPVGGIVDSSPAIAADGTLYFGAHNKKFYALDPAGQPRWTFATEAEITASPAIADDGSIYINSTDGNLYRLQPDGAQMWRCRIGGGSDSSPIIADNGNVVLAAGRSPMIVSPAGKIVWQWQSPYWIDVTPAAAEGMVCFWAPHREIWGREPNGHELWASVTPSEIVSSLVISDQGIIYFCCPGGLLAWQAPLPLHPARSSWPMFRGDARHTGRVAATVPH